MANEADQMSYMRGEYYILPVHIHDQDQMFRNDRHFIEFHCPKLDGFLPEKIFHEVAMDMIVRGELKVTPHSIRRFRKKHYGCYEWPRGRKKRWL